MFGFFSGEAQLPAVAKELCVSSVYVVHEEQYLVQSNHIASFGRACCF